MADTTPLGVDERAELDRLRAEVAGLRARAAARPAPPREHRARSRLRVVAAALVILLGCVLAPLSVIATWLDTQVTDTDAYVETVAPVIEDPAVQDAIAATVTTEVFNALGLEEIATQAMTAIAGSTDLPPELQERIVALAGPAVDGVEGFVGSQVDRVVASDQFAAAWVQANRLVHRQLVAVLTGDTREGVSVANGQVSIDIAPFVEIVKERLVDRGLTVAARIPEIHKSFVLFDVPNLPAAQSAFGLLNTLGTALPFVTVAVLFAGVLIAPHRRRALVWVGIGVALSMVVLALLLAAGRSAYLNAVPADLLAREPAAGLFDTIVRFLRTGLRAAFVLGVVVAATAYLTGPSPAAVGIRNALSNGTGRLRELAGAPGGLAGERVAARLSAYRRAIRVTVLVLAAVVLLFWDRPSGVDVLVVALIVGVLLVALEVLAAPATPRDSVTTSAPP
ncbi:hypothetical protein FE374_12630 [Georgenia yuyongxinii]|uniref:Integral membrane protein n=1 Tax=Georgenia yuyongxinii TaxID=2589797 RepID=A0A5B8CB28_9MICO|nr:hypothetical protein [Georgenia yuyongxinii]QDC25346.1 hypothetical protein FE374_12630 [Georgenia yuyongxinii]